MTRFNGQPPKPGLPPKQGLYDPANEHDACGVGFVVNMHGRKSHQIVRQGLEVLEHLTHRGATGCDPLTGDGAGILVQMPHEFFAGVTPQAGISLPAPGDYSVGNVFLPPSEGDRETAEQFFEKVCTNMTRSFSSIMSGKEGARFDPSKTNLP
jgi:glutamate synthase domain-containing protein 1